MHGKMFEVLNILVRHQYLSQGMMTFEGLINTLRIDAPSYGELGYRHAVEQLEELKLIKIAVPFIALSKEYQILLDVAYNAGQRAVHDKFEDLHNQGKWAAYNQINEWKEQP